MREIMGSKSDAIWGGVGVLFMFMANLSQSPM